MGSVCQKGPAQGEPELDVMKANNQVQDNAKSAVSTDLEKQFAQILEEVPVPAGPLKDKLAQLGAFTFDTTRDASTLTLVKANELTEGESYYGFWDPIQNMREYKGVVLYKSGDYFAGHFCRGHIQGKGRKITADLTVYEGDFMMDKEDGKGKWTTPDGCTYEGDWKAGKPEGHGVEIVPDKQRYEGEFLNGLKHGTGVCKWADGAVYEGQFAEGKHEGQGKYTKTNGKFYEGQWKDGKENGNGKGNIRCPAGTTYTGEYQNGLQHGTGKLEWDDGTQAMEGTWVQGKQNGRFLLNMKGAEPQYVEMKDGQIASIVVKAAAETGPKNEVTINA